MLTTRSGGALVAGAARSGKGHGMLTIKLIDDCVTPKGFGNVGDVMELSDDDAKLLIRAGRAIIAPTPILETTSSSEESTATTTRSTRKGGR